MGAQTVGDSAQPETLNPTYQSVDAPVLPSSGMQALSTPPAPASVPPTAPMTPPPAQSPNLVPTPQVAAQSSTGFMSALSAQQKMIGGVALVVLIAGLGAFFAFVYPGQNTPNTDRMILPSQQATTTSEGGTAVDEFGNPINVVPDDKETSIGVQTISDATKNSEIAGQFTDLTFEYAGQAEIRNVTLAGELQGVVFRVFDPKLGKTWVFSNIKNFPLVANSAPVLWITDGSGTFQLGGVGEYVIEENDTNVTYFVTTFDGDITSQYPQVVLSAEESIDVQSPTLPVVTADFSKEQQ